MNGSGEESNFEVAFRWGYLFKTFVTFQKGLSESTVN
jgi:hypothetical protein